MNVTWSLKITLYQDLSWNSEGLGLALPVIAHSSPGFGGVRCSCMATAEAENLLRARGKSLCPLGRLRDWKEGDAINRFCVL